MKTSPILLAALMLGGCVTLLPKPPPPPTTFILEARDVAQLSGAPVDAVLGISSPTGERAFLGADMIWRIGDTIAYVSQAAWSGRAEVGLQQMLAETVIRQGRFRSSTRSGEAQADYEIRWDVLDFEVRQDDMKAHFSAEVRIVGPGRRIIASQIVSTEAPVTSRSQTQAAEALAHAARDGCARIGEFAADAVAGAETAAATPAHP